MKINSNFLRFLLSIIIFLFLMSSLGCSPKHPTTYEELVQAYKTARKFKNISRINRLIYWGSMPSDAQKRILDGYKKAFKKKLLKVEVINLPEDFEMEGVGGKYVFPFKPEKELDVSYENKPGGWVGSVYHLGKKDGKVYILYCSESP